MNGVILSYFVHVLKIKEESIIEDKKMIIMSNIIGGRIISYYYLV